MSHHNPSAPVNPVGVVKPDAKTSADSQYNRYDVHQQWLEEDLKKKEAQREAIQDQANVRPLSEKPVAYAGNPGSRLQRELLKAAAQQNNPPTPDSATSGGDVGSATDSAQGNAHANHAAEYTDDSNAFPSDADPSLHKSPFSKRSRPAAHTDTEADNDVQISHDPLQQQRQRHIDIGTEPIISEQRAEELAMIAVAGRVSAFPNMLKVPTSDLKIKPQSRVDCQRRCGHDGFCDPSNEFGCGGEFCGQKIEAI